MTDDTSAQPKQSDRTIQYWEEFYSDVGSSKQSLKSSEEVNTDDGDDDELEWIVSNSSTLLDRILSLFPKCDATSSDERTNTIMHVLEIGCGVSQLSRSLLERIRQITNVDDAPSYTFVATDVSTVCLEHNRARDETFISSLENAASLSYDFLDAIEEAPQSTHLHRYNVILDKGTLDTFLFRSKRTQKATSNYPPLLIPLLNNVHRWLRHGCKAKYIIISPRSKIKSVRDFEGFATVRRLKVDTNALGGVVLVENNGAKSGDRNGTDARSVTKKTEVYIYECTRNDSYDTGKDTPFRSDGFTANDDAECPKCGMSFKEFRGNVDVFDQGVVGWARRWKNHNVHCK